MVGKNTKRIEEYIRNQLKEAMPHDQITLGYLLRKNKKPDIKSGLVGWNVGFEPTIFSATN